jgi:hypothetical protein
MCIPICISYFQFLGYFLLIFYCLLPSILMSTFCSWTFFYYIIVDLYRKEFDLYFYKNYFIKKKVSF